MFREFPKRRMTPVVLPLRMLPRFRNSENVATTVYFFPYRAARSGLAVAVESHLFSDGVDG
jgi:hypothetical protein